jgi:hypothetical protein
MLFKSCLPSHRGYQDAGPVWSVVVATLAAKWAVFPVQKHALANVGFHVGFRSLCELACAVAERTVGISNFDRTLAGAYGAILNVSLSHLL